MIHVTLGLLLCVGFFGAVALLPPPCPESEVQFATCSSQPNPCTYTQIQTGRCPRQPECSSSESANDPCYKFCGLCLPKCSPGDLSAIYALNGNVYPSADVIQNTYCSLPPCPKREMDDCRTRTIAPASCVSDGRATLDFLQCPISCGICGKPQPTPNPTASPTPRGIRRDKPKKVDWLSTVFIVEASVGLGLFVFLALAVYKKYTKAKRSREKNRLGTRRTNRY